MRFGFVLDQNRCIGCHACTVACKEENQVPLGVFRTWVKYVEKGEYPNTSRHFAVLRCNHCDNAPCIAICPTGALFRRKDGIVDLNGADCIGCKSCMQACPYDALYIDPVHQTAAKCHYCAHRTEIGLEPACVIACPVQAIIPGDLDDPNSQISRLAASPGAKVRKPEQGTQPKVFYLGADDVVLQPESARRPEQQMWSSEEHSLVETNGNPTTRVTYDAPRDRAPWGWRVSAYLWTKSIAAGVLLVAALQAGNLEILFGPIAATIALAFTAITSLLLIFDLKRPDRFYYLLLKPNWNSWLVWGAWILILFGMTALSWLGADLTMRKILAGPAAGFAIAVAGYSAFLFGQAKGRVFWRSPWLLPQLVAAAVVAGSATLLLVSQTGTGSSAAQSFLRMTLLVALAVHGGAVLAKHARFGSLDRWFWSCVILGGTVLPILLLAFAPASTFAPAALVALAGLWVYEELWIRAGQAIPLS